MTWDCVVAGRWCDVTRVVHKELISPVVDWWRETVCSCWEVMRCDSCGSQGTHLACSGLMTPMDDYNCPSCTLSLQQSQSIILSSLHFRCTVLCISMTYAVVRCPIHLSARPSVAFVYSGEVSKNIFKKFSLLGTHTILFFLHQTSWQYSKGYCPNLGITCRWDVR